MSRPSIRGDAGYSAPAQKSWRLPLVTTGIVAIPRFARYFKASGVTTLICQLRLDAASIHLPVMPGTNIEDVGWVYNPAAHTTVTDFIFLG